MVGRHTPDSRQWPLLRYHQGGDLKKRVGRAKLQLNCRVGRMQRESRIRPRKRRPLGSRVHEILRGHFDDPFGRLDAEVPEPERKEHYCF